jgi:hypothetical protein
VKSFVKSQSDENDIVRKDQYVCQNAWWIWIILMLDMAECI